MHETEISFLLVQLEKIVGTDHLFSDEASLLTYGHDETEDLVFKANVIVKPCSSLEISQIMILANKHLIPVTVRGGGTGLSGSALPIHGGILISMERLNRILEIDEKNRPNFSELLGLVSEF